MLRLTPLQLIPSLPIAVLLATTTFTRAAAPSAAEVEEAARWFRQLPIPNVKGKPYVEIIGQRPEGANAKLPDDQVRGFLLSEDDTHWTIFCDGSVTGSSFYSKEQWPFSEFRVKKGGLIRKIPLYDAAHDLIGRREDPHSAYRRGNRIAGQFVLARLCETNGLNPLATQLDNALPSLPHGTTLKSYVEEEIARIQIWQAVLSFQETGTSRSQLRDKFQNVATNFPASTHAKSARDYVEKLSRMIEEDKAHAKGIKPIPATTPEEKIAEYLFQLRDQPGHQVCQPGSCDIFNDLFAAKDHTSPAHELAKLGLTAVPSLIASLENNRLTRAVEFGRNFNYSHRVLTVGECARQILGRIACRNFERDPQKRDSAISTWWSDMQTKGERATLSEAVRSGGNNGASQAERLLLLDPAAAVSAIDEGLQKSSVDSEVFLMQVLRDCSLPAATDLLRRHLKKGKSAYGRVAAARYLHERGDPAGLTAILEEWNAWTPKEGKGDFFELSMPGGAITGLICCGDTKGMAALSARYREMPPAVRLIILHELSLTYTIDRAKAGITHSAEAIAQQENLLFLALGDLEIGQTGAFANTANEGARRLCDVAGELLAERWPDRYQFTWTPTRTERDLQLDRLRKMERPGL